MNYYGVYVRSIGEALTGMKVTRLTGEEIAHEESLRQWCEMTKALSKGNRTMYFVGNGASAAMSSHMSADASKNGGFRCEAFNDISLLTAVSNDISYEQVFAVPLRRFGNEGDILVTISSSGNSQNIVAAAAAARDLGMHVVTLSGMRPDNTSRRMGDLNFYIPADTYGLVEACHQALLHCWLDMYIDHYMDR